MPAKRKAAAPAAPSSKKGKKVSVSKQAADCQEPPEKNKQTATAVAADQPKSPVTESRLSIFERCPEDMAGCEEWFSEIADLLLNQTEIVVNKTQVFRLVEVEVYYNDHKAHQDTFIHGDEMQLNTAGHWYFHKSGKTYKGGTYKGLDITFGKPGAIPGGFLLRAFENVVNGEIVEGPCKLVDAILEGNKVDSIASLVATGFDLRTTVENPYLFLRRTAKPTKRVIVGSPRVGLTLKRVDEFKERFVMKPYRFTSTPDLKKCKQTIVVALHHQGKSKAEVMALSGSSASHTDNYIKAFEAARSTAKMPSDFNGDSLNSEALIKLYAACVNAKYI